MIKYENEMLVLDATVSKSDARAINDFAQAILKKEQARIINEINKLESNSHQTRTPLFQDTLFAKVRNIVEMKQ